MKRLSNDDSLLQNQGTQHSYGTTPEFEDGIEVDTLTTPYKNEIKHMLLLASHNFFKDYPYPPINGNIGKKCCLFGYLYTHSRWKVRARPLYICAIKKTNLLLIISIGILLSISIILGLVYAENSPVHLTLARSASLISNGEWEIDSSCNTNPLECFFTSNNDTVAECYDDCVFLNAARVIFPNLIFNFLALVINYLIIERLCTKRCHRASNRESSSTIVADYEHFIHSYTTDTFKHTYRDQITRISESTIGLIAGLNTAMPPKEFCATATKLTSLHHV